MSAGDGVRRQVARAWLRPLVPVYGLVTGLKRRLAWWGLLRERWLASPVISVGSVSAGGAGKTPVVILLTQLLAKRGYAVRILTRGYGRRSSGVERVNPGGDANWYGDEPVLMAQRTGLETDAAVFVGADRYAAGLLAEHEPIEGKVLVHVLDDGFQHRKLGRDVDVVLVTRQDLEDTLLPAGNLRESLEALRYADVIVVREEESAWVEEVVGRLMAKEGLPGGEAAEIWRIRRRLSFGEGGGVRLERPVVFSGIARPEGLVQMLAGEGWVAAERVVFADHHAYVEGDMTRLVEVARRVGADGFVTTEKDAVKLTAAMWARLEEVGPVMVARLEVELAEEKAKLDRMISQVKAMDRRRHKKTWR